MKRAGKLELPAHDNIYIVKPVYKALQLLVALADLQRPVSLNEISRNLHLPKTTAFRYLYTLERLGFVSHDTDHDLYQVGLRVWELGRLSLDQNRLRLLTLPYMQVLRDRFNETVNLGIVQGQEIVYLDIVESKHSLRMQATVGSRDPAYSTAIGKAVLAFLPSDKWRDHLPRVLRARTAQTIVSLAALETDLQRTRERGYSLDQGENEQGACCIGVPLFQGQNHVAAALSVSAPDTRLSDDLKAEIIDALLLTTRQVSTQLGYMPP